MTLSRARERTHTHTHARVEGRTRTRTTILFTLRAMLVSGSCSSYLTARPGSQVPSPLPHLQIHPNMCGRLDSPLGTPNRRAGPPVGRGGLYLDVYTYIYIYIYLYVYLQVVLAWLVQALCSDPGRSTKSDVGRNGGGGRGERGGRRGGDGVGRAPGCPAGLTRRQMTLLC